MDESTSSRARACLETLSAKRLREIVDSVGAAPASRRDKSDLVGALVGETDLRKVLELLKIAELRSACSVLALGNGGRGKADLIEHILANGGPATEPARPTSSTPPPLDGPSERGLKSALRRFVLDAARGWRGREAGTAFTSCLLQCFGWPESGPPGAAMSARLEIVDAGQRTTREVALVWKERRVLVEIVKHDVMLDFAWKDLLRVCLQTDPVPQYVVLTNQRDLHLYDLGRDREAPRLSIPLDDLPKYSEAFPFLSQHWVPGTTPKIINVSKVSREVAELVARVYRSLKEQHPKREKEVVQFTLQCILTMFAEDIGLLPQEYFTTLLYDGAKNRDVEKSLRELFRLMSTRDVPGPRAVPFFNGGLFTDPVTLPLGDAQLAALTKAAEANWKYVDPHIFGSVFQGIMNDAERHKSGAYYTAHDDIMRVVGPTIVEPWRKRIRAAQSLAELLEVRAALLKFRVLDPACGSGNFLYVAFREMYRLDTELLARIREFPSTQGQGKAKVTWGAGIQTSNFYGIDINPFAVELAKVTLNIAKKIAFDERRELAADLLGQLELDVDPSLPLDNLEKNLVCADALFTDWPEVDAIVSNPPFLGGLKVRSELGETYLRKLQGRFPGVNGRTDFCAYWFRRAHDHLSAGARAGLVGTNSIRDGNTREASTDYIVSNGGTITNAVSSRDWPGEAAVTVSMVNWLKGSASGPHSLVVDHRVYELSAIAPHLQLHTDLSAAKPLQVNAAGTSQGMILGSKLFELDASEAKKLCEDEAAAPFVRAVADGTRLFTGRLEVNPNFVVDMSTCETEAAAKAGGKAFAFLKAKVLPYVRSKGSTYEGWAERWWQPWRPRADFFGGDLRKKKRLVVCTIHAARPVFVFLSRRFFPTHSLQVFAFDDDYSFGILQSALHWKWAVARGSRIKEDTRYTMEVWTTFPWPQEPSDAEVAAVGKAARDLRHVRDRLTKENGWSLRALHQAAEVLGPHPLNDAQAALDDAVRHAYGMPADQDPTEFLLELNRLVAEDEAAGHAVQGPGLPRGLDPRDPRWTSDDCIEPPRL